MTGVQTCALPICFPVTIIDLEIWAKVKDFQTNTTTTIDEALNDFQNNLPIKEDIINSAMGEFSNSNTVKRLDQRILENKTETLSLSQRIDDNATKIIDPILNDFKINIITTENETINNNNFCDSLSELSQKLLEKITFSKITAFAEVKKKPFKYDYFIERGNSKIFNFLTKNQNGSNRLKTFDSTDDLDKLLASKKVYILANGTEMHFGSAIIAGICYGLEIPFIS